MTARWRRALPVVVAVLGLSLPASAGAHAALVSSTPHWSAVLRGPPQALRLTYDEDVAAPFARVTVTSPRGQNLAGAPHVTGRFVTVSLRPGPRGSYTVHWRMVASDDGHVTEGAFTYGVQAKPLAPAPVPGVGLPAVAEALIWLQFAGVVLAGGTLIFRALVWVPAKRVLRDADAGDGRVVLWVAVIGAAIALHAGLFGFLVDAYPILGGGGLSSIINAPIIPVRTATHVGQAWTLTTFAWLGVLALLVSAWTIPRRREPLLLAAGISSLLIGFGLSWASHPDALGTVALLADYAHLVASALWVGGAVMLVILAGVLRRLSPVARDDVVRACLLRFSQIAAPAVVVLGLAGGYLVLRELPSVSALVTSSYGVLLLLKTGVAAGALGLGAYHNRRVVPRIEAGAPIAAIRRTLTLELGLLIGALVLAAVLSQTAPPR